MKFAGKIITKSNTLNDKESIVFMFSESKDAVLGISLNGHEVGFICVENPERKIDLPIYYGGPEHTDKISVFHTCDLESKNLLYPTLYLNSTNVLPNLLDKEYENYRILCGVYELKKSNLNRMIRQDKIKLHPKIDVTRIFDENYYLQFIKNSEFPYDPLVQEEYN